MIVSIKEKVELTLLKCFHLEKLSQRVMDVLSLDIHWTNGTELWIANFFQGFVFSILI